MIISANHSERFSIASFVSIIMVLFIHGYYLEAESYPIASFIQTAIGSGLCSIAVPSFFSISGFLFFNNVHSINNIFVKQRKRVNTLLIPYILWNIVFLLWYFGMALFPSLSQFINSSIVTDISSKSTWKALVWVFTKPAGFHLWFLRDLIVFVLLAPAIFYCNKVSVWFLPLLSALLSFKFYFFSGFAFYTLGGAIASSCTLESIDTFCKKLFPYTLFVWIAYSICIPLIKDIAVISILPKLCGVMSLWHLSQHVLPIKSNERVSKFNLLHYTFFIYVFHEPFFNIVKKLMLRLFGLGDLSLSFLYCLNPILALLIIVCIAKAFQFLLPKTYNIFTGGR